MQIEGKKKRNLRAEISFLLDDTLIGYYMYYFSIDHIKSVLVVVDIFDDNDYIKREIW